MGEGDWFSLYNFELFSELRFLHLDFKNWMWWILSAEERVLSDHCMPYFMLYRRSIAMVGMSCSFYKDFFWYIEVSRPLIGIMGLLGTIQLVVVHRITTCNIFTFLYNLKNTFIISFHLLCSHYNNTSV